MLEPIVVNGYVAHGIDTLEHLGIFPDIVRWVAVEEIVWMLLEHLLKICALNSQIARRKITHRFKH